MAQESISPTWTLPMVLAWIIHRNPDKVHDAREISYEEFPFQLVADSLLVEGSLPESDDGADFCSLEGPGYGAIPGLADAEAKLAAAVFPEQLSPLRVSGRHTETDIREEIRGAILWEFVPTWNSGRSADQLGQYVELLFLEAEILERWPPKISERRD